MLVELRKNCQETIQRAIFNIIQLKSQWWNSLPKLVRHKINLILNDIQLLKDNFCLIANKIIRLQLRYDEKQFIHQRNQLNFETKYSQLMKTYQKLQIKNQKTEKQLNFIKYTNKNLKKDLQLLENKKINNEQLQSIIKQLKQLISQDSNDIKQKLSLILANYQKDKVQPCAKIDQSFDLKFAIAANMQKCGQENLQSIGFVSTERTPIKSQLIRCQGQKMDRVSQFSTDKECIKSRKRSIQMKHGHEAKTIVVIPDKKRNQLARLIQEQSRNAKISQVWAASNIF